MTADDPRPPGEEGPGPDAAPTRPAGGDAPADNATRARDDRVPDHPDRIGPYRILQVLGEGGMGTVYEAEQTETVTRRVALKVVKLGMDTRDVVARFENERQALAVMEHPGIARVLDGGATPEGRPYFVMELVRGLPLTAYCDRHELSTRTRLELFVELCRAVQHAHQKGIIHRDLKPNNVLVAEHGGRPSLKVIDFGVAKAVGAKLTEQTFVTRLGEAIGTPAYMSPEQAERSALDVDTRTDVYSLGVILYELLAGALPVDWETEGARTYLEKLARHETSPVTPSTRLAGLGEQASDVARRRHATVPSLRRDLKGDLDWIVMKAMDGDRNRRYETVNALAMEVGRFLSGEPVLARPPSLGYRAAKFVRRHRAPVAVGAVALLAVLLGLAAATYGLLRAREQQAIAQREARTANKALDFLAGMFQEADPFAIPDEPQEPGEGDKPRGEKLTAKDILERGAARLETELLDEPRARARLLAALGTAEVSLGLHAMAEPLLREAVELREAADDATDLDRAEALQGLAEALAAQARYADAAALLERSVALVRSANGPDSPAEARVLSTLGSVHHASGDAAAARAAYEHSLAILRATSGPGDPALAAALNNLGSLLHLTGERAEALALLEEALAVQRAAFGESHPNVAATLANLASLHVSQGDPAQAAALIDEALRIDRTILAPDHPELAKLLSRAARLRAALGDREGALALADESLAIRSAAYGPEHPMVAQGLQQRGEALAEVGRFAEARRDLEQAVEILRGALGPENPRVADVLHSLGRCLQSTGSPEGLAGARSVLEEALAITRRSSGAGDPDVAATLNELAKVVMKQGDAAAARPLLQEALAIHREVLPEGHPSVAFSLTSLGRVQRELGELDASEAAYREAIPILEGAQGIGPEHEYVDWATAGLVKTLREAGREEEAQALLDQRPRLRAQAEAAEAAAEAQGVGADGGGGR